MTDSTDIAILKALNHNCRIKINHLAQKVHLTPPAVTARIEHLEAAGIIRHYTIDVDLTKLDITRQVFIQAAFKTNQRPAYDTLIKHYRNSIRHHYHTTGPLNTLIEAGFLTATDLDDFLQQLSQVATYQVIDVVGTDF